MVFFTNEVYRERTVRHYLIWLDIEWNVFLAILVSDFVFIIIRSFVRHKVSMDQLPVKKQLNNIDTVSAIKPVLNVFNTSFT